MRREWIIGLGKSGRFWMADGREGKITCFMQQSVPTTLPFQIVLSCANSCVPRKEGECDKEGSGRKEMQEGDPGKGECLDKFMASLRFKSNEGHSQCYHVSFRKTLVHLCCFLQGCLSPAVEK